jgi:cation-transporting ATPase E
MTKNNSTNHTGLTSAEVAKRVSLGQVNVSSDITSRSLSAILRANLFTRFNALLGTLFLVVLATGPFTSTFLDASFGFLIVFNSSIGIIQELRAKRTLDKLAILNAPVAHVIRNGKLKDMPTNDVVLDDVIKLQVGDQVPVDGVILDAEGVEIDEALLTGESENIHKQPGDKVLSGSVVVAGSAHIKTTAVGDSAYAHKLTAQAKQFSPAYSELVAGINKLLKYAGWAIVFVAPLLIWRQNGENVNFNWQEALLRSTAAITGMIPEGLVLLTSFAFALAVLVLARRRVLVQQLSAVEGLARVDVICLDKTGTLTEGKIALDELIVSNAKQTKQAEQILASFAAEANTPTLRALDEAFGHHNPLSVTGSVPFSSTRKWSSITTNGQSWIMGAPEILLGNGHKALLAKASSLSSQGKRVMVLLSSDKSPTAQQLPANMQPVGLLVLSEKIRGDAMETLKYFSSQGVALKIISGDTPQTVAAIAASVGLPPSTPFDARNLPTDQAELAKILDTHSIFGRVVPEQKRAIIKALQSQGHVVAMTGDGVNDTLALKDADIGIAMGSGAPATKAVAELVLLDNEFAHLPRVVAEGRRVIANIERVANLFVIKNVYSVVLAVSVTILGISYPFLPRHLSLLSALTIGIPAFFLALAPSGQRYRPGFLRRVLSFSVPAGIIIGSLVMAAYWPLRYESPDYSSLVSTLPLIIVGVWILLHLAWPLNWWKIGLIGLMPSAFVLIVSVPYIQDLLSIAIERSYLPYPLMLGLVGILAIELLWRLSHPKSNPKQVKLGARSSALHHSNEA